MTALTTPQIFGIDTDVNLKGCDVMPLVSNTAAVDRVGPVSGQAVRLKLNGRTQISARRDDQQRTSTAGLQREGGVSGFSGDFHLQGIRLNQLNLAKQLNGSLHFSPNNVQILAKGLRADELLDVDLRLPEGIINPVCSS